MIVYQLDCMNHGFINKDLENQGKDLENQGKVRMLLLVKRRTYNFGVLTVFQACLVANALYIIHCKTANQFSQIIFLKIKVFKGYLLLTLPY